MNPKTQNILHWILVIALVFTAVEPQVKAVIPGNIDAILAVIFGIATKFVYYADTTQGTTPPQ